MQRAILYQEIKFDVFYKGDCHKRRIVEVIGEYQTTHLHVLYLTCMRSHVNRLDVHCKMYRFIIRFSKPLVIN